MSEFIYNGAILTMYAFVIRWIVRNMLSAQRPDAEEREGGRPNTNTKGPDHDADA